MLKWKSHNLLDRDYKYSPQKTVLLELGRIRMNNKTLPLSILHSCILKTQIKKQQIKLEQFHVNRSMRLLVKAQKTWIHDATLTIFYWNHFLSMHVWSKCWESTKKYAMKSRIVAQEKGRWFCHRNTSLFVWWTWNFIYKKLRTQLNIINQHGSSLFFSLFVCVFVY